VLALGLFICSQQLLESVSDPILADDVLFLPIPCAQAKSVDMRVLKKVLTYLDQVLPPYQRFHAFIAGGDIGAPVQSHTHLCS